MKITDALELEKQREDKETWNKIFLHKDGTFFHAYEWSAWLVKTIVCTEDFQKNRGDAKPLLAEMNKTSKGDYVILGFPVSSLSKFIPNYESSETKDNGDIVVTISMPFEDSMFETINEDFNAWRLNLPIKEKVRGNKEIRSGNNNSAFLGRSGIFQILSKVMSYPIERTTPTENIEFIGSLKQEIAALL